MDASITSPALRDALSSDAPPLVIDVRKRERFREAADLIRGAVWRDPLLVADWSKTLARTAKIVVYCVHGHEVSQGAAKALREAGMDARFLEGGIEGWRESGGELAARPES